MTSKRPEAKLRLLSPIELDDHEPRPGSWLAWCLAALLGLFLFAIWGGL